MCASRYKDNFLHRKHEAAEYLAESFVPARRRHIRIYLRAQRAECKSDDEERIFFNI